MRQRRIFLTTLMLTGLTAHPLDAVPRKSSEARVAEWNQRIATAVADLHAARWAPARGTMNDLVGEMIESIDPGKNAGKAFASALTLRAVAEVGLGNEREAAWDWQVAQQLDGNLEENPPSGFGEADAFLVRHTLHLDPPPTGLSEADKKRTDFVRPRPRTQPEIRFVENVRSRRGTGTVNLETFVDETGQLSHPRIGSASVEPAALVATIESLRNWSYEPARLAGQPVAVRNGLSVRYTIDGRE